MTKKISELTAAENADTGMLEVLQGGASKKLDIDLIIARALAASQSKVLRAVYPANMLWEKVSGVEAPFGVIEDDAPYLGRLVPFYDGENSGVSSLDFASLDGIWSSAEPEKIIVPAGFRYARVHFSFDVFSMSADVSWLFGALVLRNSGTWAPITGSREVAIKNTGGFEYDLGILNVQAGDAICLKNYASHSDGGATDWSATASGGISVEFIR
jgi:hypothetical protein